MKILLVICFSVLIAVVVYAGANSKFSTLGEESDQLGGDLEQAILDEKLRQLGGGNKSKHDLTKREPATLTTIPLSIPKDYQKSTEVFPTSATNVTRDAKGNFIRDGKPAFLIGVEAEMYNGDWLHRILGLDFSQITTIPQGEFRAAVKVKKSIEENGVSFTVSNNKPSPWMELRLKEVLRGGTLVTYDNFLNMANFYPLPWYRYKFTPSVYTSHTWKKPSSHFFDLNQENPEARNLYANSNLWLAQHGRKYPVFAVEMINEVSYINQSVENIVRFRKAMQQKYQTIEAANQAWRTDYLNFDEVFPPLNVQSAGINNGRWAMSPHGKAFKQHLWLDWSKWSGMRAGEVFKDLSDHLREYYPDAPITIQSPYAYGLRGLTANDKKVVEDIYGGEVFLRIFRQQAGREEWRTMTASMHFQFNMDLVRAEVPNLPIVNWEAGVKGYPYDKNDYNGKNNYVIGTPGMRLFFWHQAVHGHGASVISYFYGGETSSGGLSNWDSRNMSFDAIKAIPQVNNEINSLSEIVLPRPRIKGQVGFLFGYENGRKVLPYKIHAQKEPEMLDYYTAANFAKVDVDVVTTPNLLNDGIQYPLLIASRAQRINPQALVRIKEYVKNGGNVLLSPASFRIDDDVNAPINNDNFLGGNVGAYLANAQLIEYQNKDWPSTELKTIVTDEPNNQFGRMYGYQFKPGSAKVLAKTKTGAAFTVNQYGKGKVYYVAIEPDPILRQKYVRHVLDDLNIKPSIEFTFTDKHSKDKDYVESHTFSKGSKHVQYLVNFGGKRKAKFTPRYQLGNQTTVRNIATQQYLKPNGVATNRPHKWSIADIRKGIPVTLIQHDPTIFLLEDATETPLALKQLTAEQKQALSWLYRPSPASDKRVLIDSVHQYEGRMHKYRMPTAVKGLEDRGYEVNSLANYWSKPLMRTSKGVKAESLSDYDVHIITGVNPSTLGKGNEIILDYVKNGGGLLYSAAVEYKSPGKSHPLLKAVGLDIYRNNFYDTDSNNQTLNEAQYVKFKNPIQHPITVGVREFHSAGAKPIKIRTQTHNPITVFAGSKTSYCKHPWGDELLGPGQPVIVALEYGKGRIVVVGGDSWLRPDNLAWGDNQTLFNNIVDWLAKPSS